MQLFFVAYDYSCYDILLCFRGCEQRDITASFRWLCHLVKVAAPFEINRDQLFNPSSQVRCGNTEKSLERGKACSQMKEKPFKEENSNLEYIRNGKLIVALSICRAVIYKLVIGYCPFWQRTKQYERYSCLAERTVKICINRNMGW